MIADEVLSRHAPFDLGEARLLERVDEDGATFEVLENDRYRWLQTGDGTLQSAMDHRSPERLVLPYTVTMMAALLFVDDPRSVLMLGLGGGSQARFLRHHFPDADITAWEQDEAVVAMARRHFALDSDAAVRIVNEDARAVVDFVGPPVDLVLLDLFGTGGMSPWMREARVYKGCRRRLAPHGVLAANLWVEPDDEFLGVLDGVQKAFGERTLLLTVPGYRNLVALAFDQPPPLDFAHLRPRAETLSERTGIDFGALLESMRESNYSDESGFVL